MRAKFRSPQGRSTFGAVTVMFALVALLGPGSASAAEVLDANCPGNPASPSATGSSQSRVGQTFTALHTGQLTSAFVTIHKEGNDTDFSMQIRPVDGSGVPEESAASALATETVPAPASTGFGPLTANFSTPASVVAGQQYALVLQRASTFLWGGTDVNVPCDGEIWLTYPTVPSPSWGPACTEPCSDFDWLFSVFVTPPTTPPVVQPPTTAPTGQRAAALKKCKKKKKKKARKKCKKKANLLPV